MSVAVQLRSFQHLSMRTPMTAGSGAISWCQAVPASQLTVKLARVLMSTLYCRPVGPGSCDECNDRTQTSPSSDVAVENREAMQNALRA
jgi:hypothetical protein